MKEWSRCIGVARIRPVRAVFIYDDPEATPPGPGADHALTFILRLAILKRKRQTAGPCLVAPVAMRRLLPTWFGNVLG